MGRFLAQTPVVWARRMALLTKPNRLRLRMDDFRYLSDSDTVKYLSDTDYGFARFGNSELTFIAGRDIRHQRQDSQLRALLVRAVKEYNKTGPDGMRMLLGFPLDMTIGNDFFNRAEFSLRKGQYRKEIWRKSPLFVVRALAEKNVTYGSPHTFRFHDCVPAHSLGLHLDHFLRLMRRRPSIYVGPHTNHSVVSRHLRDVELIEIPPHGAFAQFDNLRDKVIEKVSTFPNAQVLVTAGLTGTALSYELNRIGIKAIDVGQSFRQLSELSSENA